MRSKKKSTASKPRLLRAFQGPVTKNPRHFQGLHPHVRGDHLGPATTSCEPRQTETPFSCRGTHRAVPGPCGRSRFHQPDRRGVLAARTPQTPPNHANPRNCGTFAQRDRTRRGVPEPGSGVVSRTRLTSGAGAEPRNRTETARESCARRRFASRWSENRWTAASTNRLTSSSARTASAIRPLPLAAAATDWYMTWSPPTASLRPTPGSCERGLERLLLPSTSAREQSSVRTGPVLPPDRPSGCCAAVPADRFRRCDQTNCPLDTELPLGRCSGPACSW